MNPFRFAQVADVDAARSAVVPNRGAAYIAGGTNILDLMKIDVERPQLLVDITGLPLRAITATATGVQVGALVTMADAADASAVQSGFPAVSQALLAGASPQLRNMATVGGNILQRTRCAYFRDLAAPCNKRQPGRGCAAIGGDNRMHAVIGTSEHCICTHPSDMAVALQVVDATVRVRGTNGVRSIPVDRFHLLPGDRPDVEHVLAWGDLIEAIDLPASSHAARSTYLKVRDRASYEFALVSVAAALDIRGGVIVTARIALGGVAPIPWRARDAEAALIGKPPTAATFAAAARAAIDGMHGYGHNDFKVTLAQRSVERALQTIGAAA